MLGPDVALVDMECQQDDQQDERHIRPFAVAPSDREIHPRGGVGRVGGVGVRLAAKDRQPASVNPLGKTTQYFYDDASVGIEELT